MALISFSGLASGIDSASLIDAILDQSRQTRIVPLQDQISDLKDTNSAFEEVSELLATLQTAAGKFRTINGGILAKATSSSDETVASATASNAASNSSFTVGVTALASTGTHSFNDRFTDPSAAIAPGITDTGNDTIDVTVGSGAGAESFSIEVTSSTSLNDIAADFNEQSSNATATIVNTGTSDSPAYALVIASNSEGLTEGELTITAGSDITNEGVFTTSTLDQATDASFTVSGISGSITRSTNTISDVFEGITLNLSKVGSSTISVGVDSASTTATMQEFVDAYNDVVNFIQENDTITRVEDGDEVENIFGPFAGLSLDNQILSSIRSSISGSGISGGSVNIFADLGVTTKQDGTLAFDTDTFQEALSSNPEDVEQIATNLGENLSAVNGTIAQYIRFNGLIDSTVTTNENSISSMQEKIATLEGQLANQEQSLITQFSRLEATIGQMQSQQQALSSILAPLT